MKNFKFRLLTISLVTSLLSISAYATGASSCPYPASVDVSSFGARHFVTVTMPEGTSFDTITVKSDDSTLPYYKVIHSIAGQTVYNFFVSSTAGAQFDADIACGGDLTTHAGFTLPAITDEGIDHSSLHSVDYGSDLSDTVFLSYAHWAGKSWSADTDTAVLGVSPDVDLYIGKNGKKFAYNLAGTDLGPNPSTSDPLVYPMWVKFPYSWKPDVGVTKLLTQPCDSLGFKSAQMAASPANNIGFVLFSLNMMSSSCAPRYSTPFTPHPFATDQFMVDADYASGILHDVLPFAGKNYGFIGYVAGNIAGVSGVTAGDVVYRRNYNNGTNQWMDPFPRMSGTSDIKLFDVTQKAGLVSFSQVVAFGNYAYVLGENKSGDVVVAMLNIANQSPGETVVGSRTLSGFSNEYPAQLLISKTDDATKATIMVVGKNTSGAIVGEVARSDNNTVAVASTDWQVVPLGSSDAQAFDKDQRQGGAYIISALVNDASPSERCVAGQTCQFSVVYTADGSQPTVLNYDFKTDGLLYAGHVMNNPQVSSDGQMVWFVARTTAGSLGLYQYNTLTRKTQLVPAPSGDEFATISAIDSLPSAIDTEGVVLVGHLSDGKAFAATYYYDDASDSWQWSVKPANSNVMSYHFLKYAYYPTVVATDYAPELLRSQGSKPGYYAEVVDNENSTPYEIPGMYGKVSGVIAQKGYVWAYGYNKSGEAVIAENTCKMSDTTAACKNTWGSAVPVNVGGSNLIEITGLSVTRYNEPYITGVNSQGNQVFAYRPLAEEGGQGTTWVALKEPGKSSTVPHYFALDQLFLNANRKLRFMCGEFGLGTSQRYGCVSYRMSDGAWLSPSLLGTSGHVYRMNLQGYLSVVSDGHLYSPFNTPDGSLVSLDDKGAGVIEQSVVGTFGLYSLIKTDSGSLKVSYRTMLSPSARWVDVVDLGDIAPSLVHIAAFGDMVYVLEQNTDGSTVLSTYEVDTTTNKFSKVLDNKMLNLSEDYKVEGLFASNGYIWVELDNASGQYKVATFDASTEAWSEEGVTGVDADDALTAEPVDGQLYLQGVENQLYQSDYKLMSHGYISVFLNPMDDDSDTIIHKTLFPIRINGNVEQ